MKAEDMHSGRWLIHLPHINHMHTYTHAAHSDWQRGRKSQKKKQVRNRSSVRKISCSTETGIICDIIRPSFTPRFLLMVQLLPVFHGFFTVWVSWTPPRPRVFPLPGPALCSVWCCLVCGPNGPSANWPFCGQQTAGFVHIYKIVLLTCLHASLVLLMAAERLECSTLQ